MFLRVGITKHNKLQGTLLAGSEAGPRDLSRALYQHRGHAKCKYALGNKHPALLEMDYQPRPYAITPNQHNPPLPLPHLDFYETLPIANYMLPVIQ